MIRLWVDDQREAPAGFHWVRTAEEAIQVLDGYEVEEIHLDHDLGDTKHDPEKTGYTVLSHIEKKVFSDPAYIPPTIKIHTANPAARTKMEAARRAIERQTEGR